jgi:hypothetical protein
VLLGSSEEPADAEPPRRWRLVVAHHKPNANAYVPNAVPQASTMEAAPAAVEAPTAAVETTTATAMKCRRDLRRHDGRRRR